MTAEQILARHRRQRRNRIWLVVALAMAALGAMLLDLCSGPAGLTLQQIRDALLVGPETSATNSIIVWQVRLPVAVLAVLVGALLSLAGTEMQTVLENPLAEPFTLGVSASAALGAGVALVLGLSFPGLPGHWAVSANAFLFSLGALGLLHLISRLRGGGTETVILLGIAINFTAAALLALVQFVASPDALQQLVFWTMGSLASARWDGIAMLALVLAACLPFSLRAAWQMTALRLGSERAEAFGLNVARLRRFALIRVSLLAGAAVSLVGVIGFVGLAGPHMARLAVGEDHRLLLPASLFTGALLTSLASVAAKMLVPGILLPLGIVTSLVGLPIFFLLILTRGRGR